MGTDREAVKDVSLLVPHFMEKKYRQELRVEQAGEQPFIIFWLHKAEADIFIVQKRELGKKICQSAKINFQKKHKYDKMRIWMYLQRSECVKGISEEKGTGGRGHYNDIV